jgi:hypothetical protein
MNCMMIGQFSPSTGLCLSLPWTKWRKGFSDMCDLTIVTYSSGEQILLYPPLTDKEMEQMEINKWADVHQMD